MRFLATRVILVYMIVSNMHLAQWVLTAISGAGTSMLRPAHVREVDEALSEAA